MTAGPETLDAYAELGVDRLVMMLGSQRPEKIPGRMGEIETLVKKAA
jgi:hypothetical protein